jgi:hypothetical protein
LFVDEPVGRVTLEVLHSSTDVVSIGEVGDLNSQLVVVVAVEPSQGRVIDRAIQRLDLSIHPSMFDLSCQVIDVEQIAGVFEGVSLEGLLCSHRYFDKWNG